MRDREVVFRIWKYFREGYSIYVSRPLGLFNFLTITYYIFLERIQFLKVYLPHFNIFAIIVLVTMTPLSIFMGWLHYRRLPIYGNEAILFATSNPLTCHIQRVSMENNLEIMKKLKIEPTKEWWKIYFFWKRYDERWKWKPK